MGAPFKRTEGACEGDSGSPVILAVDGTASGDNYFEQHFVVSTGNYFKNIVNAIHNDNFLSLIKVLTVVRKPQFMFEFQKGEFYHGFKM